MNSSETADRAYSTAQTALNSFNPTSTTNAQKTGVNDLYGAQSNTIGDLTSKYASTVASNPSVTSLYGTANDMFNVPGLTKQANYLQNRVTNAIPEGVQAARGFDIGSPQVQNGVAQKLSYLLPQETAATNNLNSARELAQGYVQAGQAQNAQNLLPVQYQAEAMNDAMARQSTGFTTAMTNELNGLIAKMQAGMQLSDAEYQRANALASMENEYRKTIDSARIGQQFQTVPAGSTLVNTFTGTGTRAV